MDRSMIVAIILGLLVLLSIFQTFQLTSIRAKVIEGTPTGRVVTEQVVTQIPTGRASQLPSQVGGC